MALVGSYSVTGPSSSITLSYEYSTVDELLVQIPDNSANLITPGDLRDSVYTLWQRIGSVSVIAASAASASSFFQNTDPTTVTVGGITAGTTFPTPVDMQTMWNQLLYPYLAPVGSLTVNGGITLREFGDANYNVTLNYTNTVLSSSYPLVAVTVEGAPKVSLSSGTHLVTITHSWPSVSTSQTQTFTMLTTDTLPTTVTTTTSINWMNKVYWGSIDLSSIGNPNMTFNPGSASLVATLCTDVVVTSLAGANVLPGYELTTTKNKTYTNINGAGNYLIFAWPSNMSGALSPNFTVNGLPNTAFTRVRTNSSLVNAYGYTIDYEVWVSNTPQNSPLTITIS